MAGIHCLCELPMQNAPVYIGTLTVLQATVLLNANVAFLAISTVTPEPDAINAAQITSYVSVIASVGSILTGLLLTRQYRDKKNSATEAVCFPILHFNKYLNQLL